MVGKLSQQILNIASLLIIILLSCCSTDPDSRLIGSWRQADRDIILEFSILTPEKRADDNINHFTGIITIKCGEVISDGYYHIKHNGKTVLELIINPFDCNEDPDEKTPNPKTYLYYIEMLTNSKLILRSHQDPNEQTEYLRR